MNGLRRSVAAGAAWALVGLSMVAVVGTSTADASAAEGVSHASTVSSPTFSMVKPLLSSAGRDLGLGKFVYVAAAESAVKQQEPKKPKKPKKPMTDRALPITPELDAAGGLVALLLIVGGVLTIMGRKRPPSA